MLRAHGVVGKFVEFYGQGVGQVPLANRATIGNMSPEFGSTAAMFPVDQVTVDYLKLTGRSTETVSLVENYAKAQGLWHNPDIEPVFSEYLELDLSSVVPSIAGPKRPQDRIELDKAKEAFARDLTSYEPGEAAEVELDGKHFTVDNGHVAIAAITSCTNTSNPSVMLAAGLLARNAVAKGLVSKPWVKTTLAPGSKVVTDYYEKAGLMDDLEALGFYLVGYGCTTCIGNSGPLPAEISAAVNDNDLAVTTVLSGNRNFEGRINPDVKMNYLASPPLVIAYALAGTMNFDFEKDALGQDTEGHDVFLADIWPSAAEVQKTIDSSIDTEMFVRQYASVFDGDDRWKSIPTPVGNLFEWDAKSTYVRKPPYFDGMTVATTPVSDISGARVLALLGDSITTDHISPAGSIKADSPAGTYLQANGVDRGDFNSYGSRRGNHEVMIRGTFANIRLKNRLLDGVEGGFTRDFTTTDGDQSFIYDASQNYQNAGTPLVILAGKEYGSGSSRDWAAKGTSLLGVKAVIAESFERIHRSNLIGMGVIPLQFPAGRTAESLGLTGCEEFSFTGIDELNTGSTPRTVRVVASPTAHSSADASVIEFDAVVRIDTPGEADYYRNGGILQYVLRSLL
jgi:aconitate hydratase